MECRLRAEKLFNFVLKFFYLLFYFSYKALVVIQSIAGVTKLRLASRVRFFELSKKFYISFSFLALLQSVEMLSNGAVVASVPYSITFASRSKKNYDDTRVDCK